MNPITTYKKAQIYREQIKKLSYKNFEPLIPCYLKEDLDIENFREGLKNKYFFGAKLYPSDATTNSKFGVNDISKIYYLLEILEQMQHPLLIHGEKDHIINSKESKIAFKLFMDLGYKTDLYIFNGGHKIPLEAKRLIQKKIFKDL